MDNREIEFHAVKTSTDWMDAACQKVLVGRPVFQPHCRECQPWCQLINFKTARLINWPHQPPQKISSLHYTLTTWDFEALYILVKRDGPEPLLDFLFANYTNRMKTVGIISFQSSHSSLIQVKVTLSTNFRTFCSAPPEGEPCFVKRCRGMLRPSFMPTRTGATATAAPCRSFRIRRAWRVVLQRQRDAGGCHGMPRFGTYSPSS